MKNVHGLPVLFFFILTSVALPIAVSGWMEAPPRALLGERSKIVMSEFCHDKGLILRRGDHYRSFSSAFAPDPYGQGRCEFD